jgi:long-chain acyl-CoA synthetase
LRVFRRLTIEKISDNIKEVKPTVITVVPRLIEKYMIKSAKQNSRGLKEIVLWAIELGLAYEPYGVLMVYGMKCNLKLREN